MLFLLFHYPEEVIIDTHGVTRGPLRFAVDKYGGKDFWGEYDDLFMKKFLFAIVLDSVFFCSGTSFDIEH